MDYSFETIYNTIEQLSNRVHQLEMAQKTNPIKYNIDLDTTDAMKKAEELKERFEEVKDNYEDFLNMLNPTPIIYSYYNCSFNYGEKGSAMTYDNLDKANTKENIKYDN